MRQDEHQAFAEFLGGVLGFYGQSVTAFAMSVWWQACENFELSQVRKAMTAHAMDPDRGQFPPKPADIVRQLQGTHADRSLMAWGKVYEAMGRVGAYTSVAFDDPAIHSAIEDMGGWPALCRSTMDELPFVQKRFCDAHKAYTARGHTSPHPAYLMGEHEAINRKDGRRIAAPVLIGDPEQAQLVMLDGTLGAKTQITPFAAVQTRLTA